jgi:hypothetical protein
MRIAIMQPYFLPYIGYFQLINDVDSFVIYDNVQFSRGWINRNRFLQNDQDVLFTLPLKKDSRDLNINERLLSDNSVFIIKKILKQLEYNYRKSPYFESVFPLIENCFMYNNPNLFDFILYSIKNIIRFLKINTKLVISSNINIDHGLMGQDKIIEICKNLECKTYINPIGGVGLYNVDVFNQNNIKLSFLESNFIKYRQFNDPFIPWLSIIDILMFNSIKDVVKLINDYKLK